MKLKELLEENSNEDKVKTWIKKNISKDDVWEAIDHMVGEHGYDSWEEYQHDQTDVAERAAIGTIMKEAEYEMKIKLTRNEKYDIREWLKKEYDFLS